MYIEKNKLNKLLFLLFLLLTYFTKIILKVENLIIEHLSNNLSIIQINNIINLQKKWEWLTFAIVPLFLLIKTTLVSSLLYIGTFFYSKTKVTFKQLFNAVVKAEFVFLGVGVLKIVWFYFFQTNYTLEDLQNFYPLSALNIVGYKGLDAWFIYPLQVLNLFELVYWLVLAYLIGKIATPIKNKENKYPIDFGLKIVASSYGSALLLWVVVVMFFTLNNS